MAGEILFLLVLGEASLLPLTPLSSGLTLQYKAKTLNPRWLEQFDLHMFDDQTSHLEVSVWDHDHAGKDDIMGR